MPDTCKSGRPLRHPFESGLYLFGPEAVFRIIKLPTREDLFKTGAELEALFGPPKWARIAASLTIDGFYEHGDFRIECWGYNAANLE